MSESQAVRSRRQPPPLLPVTVVDRRELSPRMVRLTFEGAGLSELVVDDPAASVRLLVPSPGSRELVIPTWNGNEFLLPDGSRPALRTFTPLRVNREVGRLDLEIVRHPGGAVAGWAESASPGGAAALSGPGSGYPIDPEAAAFILAGDETALPAISDLVASLPGHVTVDAHVEVVHPAAQISLPDHPGLGLIWHVRDPDDPPGAALVAAVQSIDEVDSRTRIWAAGEAASMQAIRSHLFKTLGIPRAQAAVRGYWKPPR